MRKYNTRTRAKRRMVTNAMGVTHTHTHDKCDRRDIHIEPRYDGHNHTQWDKIMPTPARHNATHKYIGMTNTIRELFPELDGGRTQPTHRGTAEHKCFIPTHAGTVELPPWHDEQPHTHDDDCIHHTRTSKIVIYGQHDTPIHCGIMRRTIHIEHGVVTVHIHRNGHDIPVKPYIPTTDKICGVPLAQVPSDIEFYHL